MSEGKTYPYGTVVVDADGETIMLLGFTHTTAHDAVYAEGFRLVWGGVEDLSKRSMPQGLIDYEDELGTRYKVQE